MRRSEKIGYQKTPYVGLRAKCNIQSISAVPIIGCVLIYMHKLSTNMPLNVQKGNEFCDFYL